MAPEFMEPFRLTEKVPGQLQLPGGEEAGGGQDVLPHPGVDFVPELCQQQPILRRFCDFFNVASIHAITKA